MASKLKFLNLKNLLCVLTILSGCKNPCLKSNYVFKGTAQFYPEKDSIAVGDTIWFTSSVPVKNTDTISNQLVDYSNASNMITDIHFDPIEIYNPSYGAVDSFAFIVLTGALNKSKLDSTASESITYSEGNAYYQNSFAIIALKKGIYAVTIIDIENSYKKCANAYISLSLLNINTHQNYLKTIYYPGSPFGNDIPSVEKSHAYCFKVY